MARRKKSKITYDSKETSTFLGLVLVLAGIFFGISAITVTEGDATIFASAKSLFGQATILTAAVLFLAGLKFLGVQFALLKTTAIVSQLILLFLVPGLLTALDGTPQEIIQLEGGKTSGGQVGFYMIRNIFGDILPTEPATKLILILLILLILPVALSLSLSQMVSIASKILSKIIRFVKTAFYGDDELEETPEPEVRKAQRLGDFNELLKRKSEPEPIQNRSEPDLENEPPVKVTPKKVNNETLEYTEGEIGEEGLKQETLKFPQWTLPPLSLLLPFKKTQSKEASIKQNAEIIEQILASFNIEAKVEDAFIGPSVVQYALNIPLGIKVAKISTLAENIALALGVDSKAVRIESIPETTYLGIEVPRTSRDMVRIKELMSSKTMVNSDYHLPVPIGKDINGDPIIGNIEKMPHLLIAGATGSGKSVLTNSFITSLIMKKTPDEVKLILVDPKQVELMDYNGIPHLITPVITNMDEVVDWLKWAVKEMENRYTELAKNQVRNIDAYNSKKGFAAMPYIVVVIDEMADMMMTSNRIESENAIVRLAQKARAVGIHLILATQRPSVNVITGIIKANIPGRIGMSVTSSTDSRVILDRIGAESLMGRGDMLYKAPDKTKSVRLQGPNIEQEEVIKVVDFIKEQSPEVEYITIDQIRNQIKSPEELTQEALGDISGDSLVEQAIRIVVQSGKGSSSFLQRRLGIGFNRAAKLLEELEEAGVVGPANGSKPREVLISDADSFIAQLRGV